MNEQFLFGFFLGGVVSIFIYGKHITETITNFYVEKIVDYLIKEEFIKTTVNKEGKTIILRHFERTENGT